MPIPEGVFCADGIPTKSGGRMTPYYESKLGKLYHGDCLEIMPELEPVDLVLTDPPYGIGKKWVGGFSKAHGWGNLKLEQNERNSWDCTTPNKKIFELISKISPFQIIWGGNYFNLPPSRCWLVWVKPERGFSLAEAEMAWTSADNVVRIFDRHRHNKNKCHPTQKPVSLFVWCLSLSWSKDADLILDPFLGSGTTAVACERLNRQWIGIEISEKYCEIAARRIESEASQLKLFA